jgi:hypothetical protein
VAQKGCFASDDGDVNFLCNPNLGIDIFFISDIMVMLLTHLCHSHVCKDSLYEGDVGN